MGRSEHLSGLPFDSGNNPDLKPEDKHLEVNGCLLALTALQTSASSITWVG